MTSKQINPHYVDKKQLSDELIKYRETKVISEELGVLIVKIVDNYSTKVSFRTYSYLEDMKSCAVCRILDQIDKIDPHKNAFAYMTTMIYNVFIGFLNGEDKYVDMKNEYRIKVWTELSEEENITMQDSQMGIGDDDDFELEG